MLGKQKHLLKHNPMKTTTLYFLAGLLFLLTSCGNTYDYWDISKFKMDNTALADNEEIKLLYASGGPGNNDMDHYLHLIVVSQKTGDTVNILTTADNGITAEDKDKVFHYFNQENDATKISQMDPEKLKDIKNVDDISKIALKKIDKVVRDPKFDYLADNHYPTVIGMIGTSTPGKQE